MKTRTLFSMLLLACTSVLAVSSSPDPAIFVSASPCDAVARHYLAIPQNMDCELIKWRLSLFKDLRDQAPAAFELTCTYGMTRPGTEGFMNGGLTKNLKGKWSMVKSKPQSAGMYVYELVPDSGEVKIPILKLDEQVLQLLDADGKLMIGNAGFSYTMNKL